VRAWLRLGLASALALAAVSLLLPYFPVYDAWAWLIWGRELMHGGFETAAGPSWKPLPVWLCAPLLAGLLTARLAGAEAGRWRWAGAALAAGSVALTADSFTPPLRQFTGGLSEPLLVALVLGAVWAALDDRRGTVLALGTAAAGLRPECWPFLALWAFYATRERPRLRAAAIAAAILIPVAWFVPDIVGTGTPLEGGETARAGGIEPLDGLEALGRALAAPLAAAWIGLGLLLWRERDALDPPLKVLLAGAVAWILLVAVMAIAGFAGLPRFLAPATAAIAILGGVGIARAARCGEALPSHGWKSSAALSDRAARGIVVAALFIALAGFAWRAAQVPGDVEVVERQTRSIDHLFTLVDRTGFKRLRACQDRVRMTRVREQTALAWKLDAPIASVLIRYRPRYGDALSTEPLPYGDVFAHAGRWRATRLPCPAAFRRSPQSSSASGRAIAGVSGAAR
jgi:hypothetical protein